MDLNRPVSNRSYSFELNKWADNVLDNIASVGQSYDRIRNEYVTYKPIQTVFNATAGMDSGREAARIQEYKSFNSNLNEGWLNEQWAGKYSAHKFPWLGLANDAANVFDAATGTLNTMSVFAKEREAGSKLYPKTMISVSKTVAQTAAATAGGMLAAGTAMSMTGVGSVVGIPLIAGGLGAMAGGYLVGKVVNWIY